MIVIVNKANIKKIQKSNSILITDRDIYDYLNGEKLFFGVDCSQQHLPEDIIADTLSQLDSVKQERIILHTFNPIILNYFEDDFAIKNFYYQDKNGNLVKLFDHESMREKLTMAGPGEVVCDTIISEL